MSGTDAEGAPTMRAIVHSRYGMPDVLHEERVPIPSPSAKQVLIKVVAVGVNLSDWEGLRGSPAYARIGGLLRPRRHILGSDIAGIVTAVGSEVSAFRPGDEVYGDNLALTGGFAEYTVAPESAIAMKPAALTFAQAATIPQSGAIATQAIEGCPAGGRMLLNGAGGGTGMFCLQLAAAAGIRVTGVDNAGKLDFMRELGAAEVIDYRADDFTHTGPYDLVVDLVASRSVFAYRRALAPGGRYRLVGGTVRTMLRVLTIGALIARFTNRRIGVLAVRSGPRYFQPLAEKCASGDVRIVIDRVFPLSDVPEALAYVGAGKAHGKVVIAVDPDLA